MDELLQIDLNDITKVMNLYLDRVNYPHLDNNTKKEVIEIGIKKYISNKIKEKNNYLFFDQDINLYQLVEALSFLSGINNDNNIANLIEFLLYIMSNEQQFAIKWYRTNNEKFTAKPNIVVQHNLITHIETSEYPNTASVFNYLFNYYINQFNENRTR